MSRIISIEGNIGSGKSTLVRNLQNHLNNKKADVIFLQEPVDVWNTIKDENGTILEQFYKDQEKYGFSFQMMAYISRLSILRNAIRENPKSVIVTERSLYTDKYVFAKMLYEQGNIEEIEWKTYNYWFDTFKELTKLDGLIYVNTSPEICFDRIKKRNRNGESDIPIEYLNECDKKHHDWIDTTEIKKIIINGNDEFENNNTKKSLIIEL